MKMKCAKCLGVISNRKKNKASYIRSKIVCQKCLRILLRDNSALFNQGRTIPNTLMIKCEICFTEDPYGEYRYSPKKRICRDCFKSKGYNR